MKKFATSFALALAFTAPAHADDSDWVGLYQGIDPFDGSVDLLSIVPDGDDGLSLIASSDRVGACDGAPGHVTGQVVADNGSAKVADRTFSCAGETDRRQLDDTTMPRDEETGSLIMVLTVPEVRRAYFHSVSE